MSAKERRNINDEDGFDVTTYPNGAVAIKTINPCAVCVKKREFPIGDGVWEVSFNKKMISICSAHKDQLDRAAFIEGVLNNNPFHDWW